MSGLINKIKHAGHHDHSVASSNTLNSDTNTSQRTVVDAPIIQETVRQDRVLEVQPVVHREVDKNVVHHIEKHIQEPSAPSMGGVIERNPLVQQNVHTNVVNEIQPVIHRERVVPVAERVEEHKMQRIVEPTIHTHEVVYENAPMSSSSSSSLDAEKKHGLFHRH